MIRDAVRGRRCRLARVRWLVAFVLAASAGLRAGTPGLAEPAAPASLAGGGHGDDPTSAEARRRIAALRAEIAHHDQLYFREAAPEISDYAYDQLKRELNELAQRFPDAAGAGPADLSVGDDRTGLFPTWRHRERMLSLDKTYDEAELRAFLARVIRQLGREDAAFVVEPKMDGLAVSATYEQGKLVRVVTRGNGLEGDDITPNALAIRSLPRELRPTAPDGSPNPIPAMIELRGEVYVTWAEFERLNRERQAADEPIFAHPRNLAAGTARTLDPWDVAERKLDVVFYGWGACEPATVLPATQHGFHEQARAWGLPVLAKYWTVANADEVWPVVQAFDGLRSRLAFPADGAVVKLDSVPWRRQIGETGHAPRWAMAYKYAPARVETRLLAITVQAGRTGLLTPVAELAPVQLAGSTVARATLHNREAIARQDLRIGDIVYVEKAGEIIPAVTGVDLARRAADAQPYVFPACCPVCGAAVVQLTGEAATRCPNPECPAQVRQRLRHFASKSAVDIAGFGPVAIAALVKHGRLKNIADFYRLRREDLLTVGRDREISASSLLAAIERSKTAELWRFIHGLGIPHVGPAMAMDLARRFGSLEALATASRGDFAAARRGPARRFGDATIDAVLLHFNNPQNRAMVEDLLALGVKPTADDRDVNPAGRMGPADR